MTLIVTPLTGHRQGHRAKLRAGEKRQLQGFARPACNFATVRPSHLARLRSLGVRPAGSLPLRILCQRSG